MGDDHDIPDFGSVARCITLPFFKRRPVNNNVYEGKLKQSSVGQKYGGASSPKMTLFSLSIKSLGLIMGLLAIAAGIFILIGR